MKKTKELMLFINEVNNFFNIDYLFEVDVTMYLSGDIKLKIRSIMLTLKDLIFYYNSELGSYMIYFNEKKYKINFSFTFLIRRINYD